MMKGIMFWTLVLVIPSFVFFYGWQRSEQQREAERLSLLFVKDRWWGLRWRPLTEIDPAIVQQELARQYEGILQGQGIEATREDFSNLITSREVARQMQEAYYLQRLAEQEGLAVTEPELRAMLAQAFAGQTSDAIRRQLAQMGMTEEQLANDLIYRETLAKARNYIFARAKASLFELWQEYLIGQEKIQIQYVRIPTDDFAGKVTVTTDALRAYYDTHSSAYRVGDRAQFRYVAIRLEDITREMHPTTEALTAYYEKHKKDLFAIPRTAEVRHIMLKLPTDAATTAVEAATKKINDLAAKIKGGADFAQLADEFSEDPLNSADASDPSRKRGGQILSPVRENAPVVPYGDEFKRVALALQPDQVSSPVRTAMGLHLIKCDKATSAGIRPFEEVKDEVADLVRSEMAEKEFNERGRALKELLAGRSFSNLDSFAEAAKLPVEESPLVDLDAARIPGLGSFIDDLELVKDLMEGEFTEGVLRNREAYFVLELKKKEPAHIPPFEKVIESVREDYVTSQAAQLAHAEARDLLRQSKTLDDLKKFAEAKGYTLVQSEPFTREQADRVLPGLDPLFRHLTLGYTVGTLHLTTQGDPRSPIAYVVWYFEKREEPSREQFRKELAQVRAEYLMYVQQALLKEWLHDMRRIIPTRMNPAIAREEGEAVPAEDSL